MTCDKSEPPSSPRSSDVFPFLSSSSPLDFCGLILSSVVLDAHRSTSHSSAPPIHRTIGSIFHRHFGQRSCLKSRYSWPIAKSNSTRAMEAAGARSEPGHASSQHTSEPQEQAFLIPEKRRLPSVEQIAAHGLIDNNTQVTRSICVATDYVPSTPWQPQRGLVRL